MTPRRVQLSRKKCYRKPDGAVAVARPSRWGNPFVVHPGGLDGCSKHDFNCTRNPAAAVTLYRHALLWPISGQPRVPSVDDIKRELHGKDLACWCPLDQPCHADVLLEIANGGAP